MDFKTIVCFLSPSKVATIDVDSLLQLPMVACLDLQNNSINQVPPQLGNVTSLKLVLQVSRDNPPGCNPFNMGILYKVHT